ncbi:16S rRNA (adenine(1518)-N(6)/adenine(1519)-N(6))-dimethyltransferase RsmA [Occallatibacter savannae]|uniref:16S rRNA (adenine(1518)-N(6)/adenine(1519)-N(6))- dimethyltransferase RsmA n=1 Tax=Occallatibacter savannae TaxID=1002691 RepID=UPI000D6872BF|nr:16S rRNA (adenine(1518)-N(6)/adenine(1519)-N(6))-dimethyltransferase RsmA [Occallatibacter savannae]
MIGGQGASANIDSVPPKSKLGQNFLRDPKAVRRIVAALGDCSGSTVVEIGPGRGAITRELMSKAKRVVALEIDEALTAQLSGELTGAGGREIVIENADVLAFDFEGASRAAGGKLVVVGNLPYYITSPILMRLADSARALDRAVLMVQREVADRVTAKPRSRDFGLLSVMVQMHGPVEPIFTLPPSAFSPPPEVHSTVFRWRFAPRFEELGVDRDVFVGLLRKVFALKRKTLANNLRAAGMEPETIARALEETGVDAKARAEELPPEKLASLCRWLQEKGSLRAAE